ncbi:uncharacterized protein TNCV_4680251 [Trichonephila clavipes]|nr:uncharacterized protein TNCV_4680251 [Trichonephila clavipes]
MDLPSPVSQKSYERIMRKINLASREVADDSMKNAAKEEVSASGSNEICVSGDGPKSGHSYEEWKLKHQPHCVKNHIGSSSKMEVDGMKEIFQRSVPQRNAKYIKYIGDGDTKTFPELQRTAPYSIEKVECVGHIQKRMGARLRKLKTMNRGKKLSDGKSISGKNRLTDKFIDTITTYYGNAIRQNNSSVSDMRQAIWAIYCHYRSTDEEPMHHFCPIGDTSWCKYQKAVATNIQQKFHDSPDIFKLDKFCYLSVKIDTYKHHPGAAQCYNCNLFHHSSKNCDIKTRCFNCGGPHKTGDCPIKEKIENPTCINCNEKGHIANSHRCAKFLKPQPKKGDAFQNRNRTTNSKNSLITNPANVKDNISFANALKGDQQMAPLLDKSVSANSKPEATPIPLQGPKNNEVERQKPQNSKEAFGFMDAIIELKKFFTDYPSLLELGRQLRNAKGNERVDVFFRHLMSIE